MYVTILLAVLLGDAGVGDSNAVQVDGASQHLTVMSDTLVLVTRDSSMEGPSIRTMRFRVPEDGQISEMRLERWGNYGGLCAVIEVNIQGNFQYHCLTIAPQNSTSNYQSASAKFLDTTTNMSILAVNGSFEGDSVLALLGEIEFRKQIARVVTSGVIYLDDCPTPPTRGSLSRFDAETEIDPALSELLRN